MKHRTVIIFACSLLLDFSVIADEFKDAKIDFYKGAQEFVNEIDSIILNKQYLKKLDLDERYEGKVENIEMLEDANRTVGIKSFEQYLIDYPDSEYVPDVLYRLGKLYFEESSQKLIKDTESYEKEYKRFVRGEIQVLPPEPAVDYSKATKHLNKLVKDFVGYRFRDEALYLLGYCYFEEGQVDKSVEVFNQLIREFPKSDKLAEVYTRLGEHYFDADDFDRAVYYYTHVLEYPDSVYYENVLYKLAWVYYHRGKVVEASDYFVTLIDHNEKQFGEDFVGSFKNESKNYIAIGFADSIDGIKEAYSFFRRIGGRHYEYEVMTKISDLYLSSERIPEAIESIAFILKNYPYNPDNPVLQDKLISHFRRDEKMELVNKEREKMVLLFGENSEWRKKNIENKAAIINADQLIEKQLVSVAYYHQDKGDKNKDRKEYIKAANLYYNFLKSRPSDIMSVGARFNYAQVLFNLGDYKGSANEYKAVREYTGDVGYKEKSSFGLVSSLQNWIKTTDPKYTSKEIKPLLSEKGELLHAKSLNKLETDLVDACDKYIDIASVGKRAAYVMYVKAEVLFRNNKLADARAVYEKIIDNNPNDKISIDSMKNLIATYNYEKNYDEVKRWGNRLLATKSFENKGDIKEIKGLVTGSLFRSAKKMEDEGKLAPAAEEYVRLAKLYPKSEYSDAALYNAGVIYEKTGDSALAIRSYRTMLTKYPKSKHSASAMFRVAVNYEQRLDFDGALYFYEEITKKYSESEFATDAEYNAYRLRRGRSDYYRASEHLMRYQVRARDAKERSTAILTSAWLYGKSGDSKKALETYQLYIAKYPKDLDGGMKARLASGNILSGNGKYAQATAEYENAIHYFKVSGSPTTGSAVDYNAEARFKILEELNTKYNSIKIKNADSGKAIKENYDKKDAMLQKLAEEYLKVVELGSAQWSVASLYMIGAAFQGFANFLYEAPVPSELNNQELVSEYKRQIEQQAMPFEDKAIEYYEKCIDESARLKLVNDWTRLAKNRMSELNPDQYYYGKVEETVSSPAIEIKDYGFVGR